MKSSEGKYLISAIVSTYNSEEFMRECLEDLENQTIADQLQIIVVDAASPQNEKAIVEEFQQYYSNIKYIRTDERIGVYAAWNLAIKASSGKYITPFSTNDRLRKEAYEILSRSLDQNPDVMLVYGDSYLTNIPHETFERHKRIGAFQWPDYSYEDLLKNSRVGPHPMWRKSVHEEIGYFDEKYIADGDQEFWLRMGERYKLLHVPEFTGLFWVSTDSLSLKGNTPLRELTEIRAKYQKRYMKRLSASMHAKTSRHQTIASNVSVIIPVKNAGGQLSGLLGKIRSQRKVQDVEIVVVDSESTDNSAQIARGFGAKVIHIPQREFNRGRILNLGTEEAGGDYLVFTVQDAMPINDYWLYKMICPFIEHPELAVLSSKQFVKPEADLFGLWTNEALAESVDLEGDTIYTLPEDLKEVGLNIFNSLVKKRSAFFNNGSFCIRKAVLDENRSGPLLNMDDIDFAIKLLERGQAIGYLTSTGVYHWREMGADCELKRYYISTKTLKNDPSCSFDVNNIAWEQLITSIAGAYNLINTSIAELGDDIDPKPVKAVRSFIHHLRGNIDAPDKIERILKEREIKGDGGLDLLLSQVIGDTTFIPSQLCNFKQNFLIPDFMNRFGQFAEYLYRKNHTLKGREKDFIACIYKIFAMTAGESLGAYYIKRESLNYLTPGLKKIDRLLAKDICYF